MVVLSIPAVQWFGIVGFLAIWLAVEGFQVLMIHSCNTDLFNKRPEISLRPACRLGLVLGALVVLVASTHSLFQSNHYFWQGIAAISVMGVLAAVSYFAFNLRVLLNEARVLFVKVPAGFNRG
jgi:hypothetical protein